ncbi:MAG: BMC domain-containing protein [Pirellulaceae bacterium]
MAIQPALGILEVNGFTPGIVALDAMEKAAGIRVLQAELNDFLGVVLKIQGPVDSVRTAIDVGHRIADQMHGGPRSTVLPRPDERAWPALESRVEFNPLIQQDVVHLPRTSNSPEQPSEGAPWPIIQSVICAGIHRDSRIHRRFRSDRYGLQGGQRGSAGQGEAGRRLRDRGD